MTLTSNVIWICSIIVSYYILRASMKNDKDIREKPWELWLFVFVIISLLTPIFNLFISIYMFVKMKEGHFMINPQLIKKIFMLKE